MHVIGVPVIENCKRGMKKQVGKSQVFTKNTLTEIQDIQEGLINKISEYARGEAEDLETEIYHSLVNSKDEQQAKQSIETSTTDWASRINKYAEEQI